MQDEGVKAPSEPQPKHEMVFLVAKKLAQKGVILHGEGCLKIAKEGYGFLRFSANSYCEKKGDIFVDSRLIKHFGLLEGQTVKGILRVPEDQDNYFRLREVESFEDMAVGEKRKRKLFENLKPDHPKERLVLERSRQGKDKDGKQKEDFVIGRVIDVFAPIGKGQRGLIVSPPKSGKTTMMKQIAHAIEENHPEVELTVLLIDERPEEVTDMQESIESEVVAATFDDEPSQQVTVAEAVIAKAKRRVEIGKDVVILLDSITRLARAYNTVAPHTGRTMSGGLDAEALPRPKRFFGAARNIRGGGSLTIIATALVETGSRMDDIIYEEFKGTSNMEILLARAIAEKGIYPAVNYSRESSTRREEFLLDKGALQVSRKIREVCADQDYAQTAGWINKCMSRTDDNVLFIEEMKKTLKIED